jgi:hypothetical protein
VKKERKFPTENNFFSHAVFIIFPQIPELISVFSATAKPKVEKQDFSPKKKLYRKSVDETNYTRFSQIPM